jgi:hypothetical protein
MPEPNQRGEVHIHTHTYVHTQTCTHARAHTHVHINPHRHTPTYRHTYTHTNTHTHSHMHVCTHTHTHPQTHLQINTHTHQTKPHTRIKKKSPIHNKQKQIERQLFTFSIFPFFHRAIRPCNSADNGAERGHGNVVEQAVAPGFNTACVSL